MSCYCFLYCFLPFIWFYVEFAFTFVQLSFAFLFWILFAYAFASSLFSRREGKKGRPNDSLFLPAELVKCPYCPRSYRHQNNLRTHIRCFHKGVRIPCPICHRGFTRWFTVRCHIAREHQNVDFSRPEALPAQLRRALYPPYPE